MERYCHEHECPKAGYTSTSCDCGFTARHLALMYAYPAGPVDPVRGEPPPVGFVRYVADVDQTPRVLADLTDLCVALHAWCARLTPGRVWNDD